MTNQQIIERYLKVLEKILSKTNMKSVLASLDKDKDATLISELSDIKFPTASEWISLSDKKDAIIKESSFVKISDTYLPENKLSIIDAVTLMNDLLKTELNVKDFKLPPTTISKNVYTDEDIIDVHGEASKPTPEPFNKNEVIDLSCELTAIEVEPFTKDEVTELDCEIDEDVTTNIDPDTGLSIIPSPTLNLSSIPPSEAPSVPLDVISIDSTIPDMKSLDELIDSPNTTKTSDNAINIKEMQDAMGSLINLINQDPSLSESEKECVESNLLSMEKIMTDTQSKLERKEVIDIKLVSLKRRKIYLEILKNLYVTRYASYSQVMNDLLPIAKKARNKDEEIESLEQLIKKANNEINSGKLTSTEIDSIKSLIDDKNSEVQKAKGELNDIKAYLKIDKSKFTYKQTYDNLTNIISSVTNEIILDNKLPLDFKLELLDDTSKIEGIFKEYISKVKIIIKDADSKEKVDKVKDKINDLDKDVDKKIKEYKDDIILYSEAHERLLIVNEGFFFQDVSLLDNTKYTAFIEDKIKYSNFLKTNADISTSELILVDDEIAKLEIEVNIINNDLENLDKKVNQIGSCTNVDYRNTANEFFDPVTSKGTEIHPISPFEIDYWLKFSALATVINLIPLYWPIGLLIPTPAGIIKVPMPIVWIPITVIPTPFCLIVFFIGQCGVLPSPFLMIINMTQVKIGPVSPMSSWFLAAIRPMQEITNKVELKPIPAIPKLSINGGEIDIDPKFSQTLPMIVDDFPKYQNLKLSNIPYVFFLTKWATAGKKGGGFAENP